MNKKALQKQTAIFFLLLTIATLSNALGYILQNPWFRYIHIVMLVATIVYYVVSNKKIKNNK